MCAVSRAFETFENLRYRFDLVTMPDSLKFIGLSTMGDFSQIEVFHQQYASLVRNKAEPYTEVGLWQNLTTEDGRYDYVYGAAVKALDSIPVGLVGADTGFVRFAVMTVRCETVEALLDAATFRKAHDSCLALLPPSYAEQVCPVPVDESKGFAALGEMKGGTSLIEIYPHDFCEKKEFCLYIPLQY